MVRYYSTLLMLDEALEAAQARLRRPHGLRVPQLRVLAIEQPLNVISGDVNDWRDGMKTSTTSI